MKITTHGVRDMSLYNIAGVGNQRYTSQVGLLIRLDQELSPREKSYSNRPHESYELLVVCNSSDTNV